MAESSADGEAQDEAAGCCRRNGEALRAVCTPEQNVPSG